MDHHDFLHVDRNLRKGLEIPTLYGGVHRSSRSQMFFKIGVFKNFANFTGRHLCWCLFLIKLLARPATLKRDCNTGVFL